MKKTVLKDDNGKSVEAVPEAFIDHINQYHKAGTSIHNENSHYFTVNKEFRKKLKK